jgi:hypothetical protein
MKLARYLLLLALGLLALSLASRPAAAQDKKGETVELDGLKAPIPATWKEEKPDNRMRFLQYWLPSDKNQKDKKEDKDKGELVVFKGFGGSAEANIKRWKETFIPPDGKTIDEASKVKQIKIGGQDAVLLDVSGTYKFKAAPFDPKSQTELRPNSRMIAIHFEGKNDQYHIRMVGPAKTVDQYAQGFEDWLKALK